MNPIFTYKCPAGHFHDRPGKLGEAPPERVTCNQCAKTAGRYYGRPPAVKYTGTGWTGAQKGNERTWNKEQYYGERKK